MEFGIYIEMCIRVSPLKWNANEENTETINIHQIE